MTRNWHTTSQIKSEHRQIEVRQVYAWLISTDSKILIVSKDNVHWQQPGGHPVSDESMLRTISREVQEETGLRLSEVDFTLFGYYLIRDKTGGYLQLRMRCDLAKPADEYSLTPAEGDDIRQARFASLTSLEEYLPWLGKDSEERIACLHAGTK